MLSQNDLETITYDATVVTGLEKLAIREFEKKISNCVEIKHSVGHVIVKTPTRFEPLAKLHSVDNIYVVIYQNKHEELTKSDSRTVEKILQSTISNCNWKTGIAVWLEASKFNKCGMEIILDKLPDNIENKPTFRVSCNRSGTHQFTSQEACSVFGGIINDVFLWPVSLKKFDIELLLTIKDDNLKIAICLTKESLYKRYIVSYGVTSLRGTIAYNLIQIANIQDGEIVCDPLCGSGVIPVECSISWPQSFVLAGDNFEKAIEKTNDNFKANELSQTNIVQWDATKLPFNNGIIDIFITDLPFGKRMGSKYNNRSLYPLLVAEMVRCCCPKNGRIILLTQDKHNANKVISNPHVRKFCRLEKTFFVKVGGLDSSIYLLKRNSVIYETIE